MQIYFSAASPFVRKVMVAAQELGLEVGKLPSAAHPVNRDRAIIAQNPLGQVPTFLTEDGTALYDSRVICEYLDHRAGGGRLFPAAGDARWRALVEQSLADGILDAALLARYESVVRPAERRWDAWLDGQMDKVATGLDGLEAQAGGLGMRVDIGTISIGCALGYLDFRFPALPWRDGRGALGAWYAQFGARPAMRATEPVG